MTNPIIKIHNVETGEVVERAMSKTEADQNIVDAQNQAAFIAELQAKTTAKQTILERLGITAEEAALLLK